MFGTVLALCEQFLGRLRIIKLELLLLANRSARSVCLMLAENTSARSVPRSLGGFGPLAPRNVIAAVTSSHQRCANGNNRQQQQKKAHHFTYARAELHRMQLVNYLYARWWLVCVRRAFDFSPRPRLVNLLSSAFAALVRVWLSVWLFRTIPPQSPPKTQQVEKQQQ